MTSQRYALLEGTNVDDVPIPMIGLGTWPMTGAECQQAVASALEAGYRHVDTAENYANEDAVGRAVVGATGSGSGRVSTAYTSARRDRFSRRVP